MFDRIRAALLDAASLFAPVECAGCGRPDRSLCDECRLLVEPLVVRRSTPGDLPCFTALRYESEVRRIVLAFKEENRTDLVRSLAPAVRAALLAAPDDTEVLVVPTSREAFRRRGYDPVLSLAKAAGYSPARDLVIGRSSTQKKLTIEQRAENRTGSMRARRRLDGRRFVILDDVLTTGATIDEAARAVREAGGEAVASAALAFTPRLFGSSVRVH